MRKFRYVRWLLSEYKQEHGDLDIPSKCTYRGYELGNCVHNIRTGNIKLTPGEREALDELGFIWCKRTQHPKNTVDMLCEKLQEYQEEHGHCDIMVTYVTKQGVHLGRILDNIEKGYRQISEEEKAKLDAFHYRIVKAKKYTKVHFEEFYRQMLVFEKKFHHCNVKQQYVTEDGFNLGYAVWSYKYGHKKITAEQRKMLEDIGFEFGTKIKRYTFEEVFDLILKYREEHGHCSISSAYRTKDGISLGQLAYHMKTGRKKLTDEQRERLNSIGFDWGLNKPSI